MALIELENVSVDFPVIGGARSFRKALVNRSVGGAISVSGENRSQQVAVKALQDINISLTNGDRIGLIGHNGSGKTTMLKVLAGICSPTTGSVKIQGEVSALFSAGLGMDPEDTGYDNIHTCALYLGKSPKEIEEMIPDIEEFTELGAYLSLPVRTYSSGMMVRLAFAITTAVSPEILLLDEGLGAGDARFAEKANKRVNEMISRAQILVLASHSDALIQKMCKTCLLLEGGLVTASGDVDEVLEIYNASN